MSGRTYLVLRSQTLDFAEFDVLATGSPGIVPTTSYTDTTVGSLKTAFYTAVLEE